jgi:hypothetical protein
MKLRYVVLVTLVAAAITACGESPTASKSTTRSTRDVLMAETDTVTRGGGTMGSGH